MRTRSAAFDVEVARSHRLATLVEVLSSGSLTYSGLAITSGSVDVDGTASTRRTSKVTVSDPTLVPADGYDLLAPYGNEIRLWRGVEYADGSTELLPLITAGIYEADTQGGDTLVTALDLYDRSRRISENRWTSPYVIAKGTNYADAIRDLVADRAPSTTFSFAVTTELTPLIVLGDETDGDPWEDAVKMATAIGMELYFDPYGTCVLEETPDPDTSVADATYAEGAGATILDVGKKLTREGMYNGVVATGESTSNPSPYRYEVWDDNPASPTYYLGAFGRKPRFYSSPLIHSDAQAEAAARSILTKSLGASEVVDFGAIVQPAHEAYDVVEIAVANAAINDRYLIESFTIPLDAESPMTATTRARKVLS